MKDRRFESEAGPWPSSARQATPAQQLLLARFLADLLDQRFTIPGTSIRIGLDPILGLIPGVGDIIANVAGSMILVIAAQFSLPKVVLLRMGINVAINALIGAIPVFGDIFSIWFRSNAKNAALLERYAATGPRRAGLHDWLFVAGIILVLAVLIAGIAAGIVWLIAGLSGRSNDSVAV
ncbi:MAG: DUF4112 domain-containing protein [Candidatus Binatia bacterium]